MDKLSSFWQDNIDVDQFRDWHEKNHQHMLNLRDLTRIIDKKNYTSILDCGAGLGQLYNWLQRTNPDIRYQGMEITKKFVDDATAADIPMILGDIENIPYEDDSFDVCVASAVLNHLHDYRPAIKEMLRVAKKEILVTFFKPSVETFGYLAPELRKITMGWYPGEWDPGNLPTTSPVVGFYPSKHNHCPIIIAQKKYNIYKSPLGFYMHAEEDENGEPTCIHHHFEMAKFFNFLNEIEKPQDKNYNIFYAGPIKLMKEYEAWTKEPDTPDMEYYATIVGIEIAGDENG